MSTPLSFAVGRIHPQHDPRALLWGMFDALDHQGLRLQVINGSTQQQHCQAATAITGLCPRHLDSWSMPGAMQHELHGLATLDCDLSVVWGNAGQAVSALEPSSVSELSQQLQLPLLLLLDATQLKSCLPRLLPQHAVGILLDQVADQHDFIRWQTELEALTNMPVLGGLPALPELRAAIPRTRCQDTSRELYRLLGQEFSRYTPLKPMLQHVRALSSATSEALTSAVTGDRGIRIAVAYDEVFRCYFPDMLQLFELAGATVIDFSPLHDEQLPHDVDFVYLGDGQVISQAAELLANRCMSAALREHVCQGKRIYAEGGGLAYLCEELHTPDFCREMLGILPATAKYMPSELNSMATTITTQAKSWLTEADESYRVYRQTQWEIQPHERATILAAADNGTADVIQRHQAIGSRLQWHFASQRHLIDRCLQPCPAALSWSSR